VVADAAFTASLAIGPNLVPHIVYHENRGQEYVVVHARGEDGAWATADVSAGTDPIVVVDGASSPAIAFIAAGGKKLQYAEPAGGGQYTISSADVVGPGDYFFPGGLTLDSNDNPHLCYVALLDNGPYSSHYELRYAHRVDRAWQFESILQRYVHVACRIAVDRDGTPHIAQSTLGGDPLLWHTRTLATWETEVVDPRLCKFLAPVIDDAGTVRIAYGEEQERSVMMATKHATAGVSGQSSPPASSGAIRVRPNPFAHSTSFEISGGAGFSLEIYNTLGQVVWSGEATSRLSWDGMDERGVPAPTGVYFFSIRTDGEKPTMGKISLLR
jgi:hypothetical protein